MQTKNNPKISVITVVFKDPEGLERTISSVQDQSYDNIEHIIIDGGSGQETLDIIEKYKSKIDYWISESDNGIYDAMNKGIKASSGQWINFMNAGDTFYAHNTIANVFKTESYKNKSLIYGYKYSNGKATYPSSQISLSKGFIMACHQSMFFNHDYIKDEIYYDLRYPILGDYDLISRISLKFPDSFQEIDMPIAIYEGGGISSQTSNQMRIDKYSIIYRHYGIYKLIKAIIFRIIGSVK